MSQHVPPQSRWWGQFNVADGQTAEWEIGPLRLAIQRLSQEWRVAYERDDSLSPDPNHWKQVLTGSNISELGYANLERYIFGQTHPLLSVMPMLADRPVITRPLTPLSVPAGELATIFVSSLLWVWVEVGDPPKRLQEIPILRPSDTWFGPSTMEGELCYASRTYARLTLDNVTACSHRATTQVAIHNRAASHLQVERLSLPVPYLSLFEGPDGLLWTQAVTMQRTRDTEMATFQVEQGPPREIADAIPVSSPRQQFEESVIIRAFGTLFG
jgi:hypothetical protein